ncbi:hypothetical protein BG004_006433 [Podila humilis]|nr:hypothetical protein BG004_006433 [Podila humilis]
MGGHNINRPLDLNGEWRLSNGSNTIQATATVPGQVHVDLIAAGILQDNLYFGNNYVEAIIHDTWILERIFHVTDDMDIQIALLDCEGLDTFATLFVNDKQVTQTENQFRRYQLDITNVLIPGQNKLRIQFDDATRIAKEKAESYPYYVPDMFSMSEAQHGFPRRNMIRKEQCSFSWDWGPAFAPCGIWRPISLRLDQGGLLVSRWTIGSKLVEKCSQWEIKIDMDIHSVKVEELEVTVELSKPGHGIISSAKQLVSIHEKKNQITVTTTIEEHKVERWCPRGFGNQVLYDVKVTVTKKMIYAQKKPKTLFSHTFSIGFRTCDLVQKRIYEDKKGDSFHVEVNGIPIFAKGTNWIPGHVFDQLMPFEKKRYLLESCAEANMNMIRVWGGGRYETEDFYTLCDRLGIMVWQEFMFACALYPVDALFMENVRLEVIDQVSRLQSHPSIVLWSGNNENQEFMVKSWDKAVSQNPYLFAVDYHKLNVETIYRALSTVDQSRPFISSSPSAGMISHEPFTERYVLDNSERGLFGDVHFYDYRHNEYGAQSMPSFKLLKQVSLPEDWHPRSKLMVHRNHHGNGQEEMLEQIEYQFELPLELARYYRAGPSSARLVQERHRRTLMDSFCYLTQIAQARSICAQTEHYVRGRSEAIQTMGALYWQLNDIWPGPTWRLKVWVVDLASGQRSYDECFPFEISGQGSKRIATLSNISTTSVADTCSLVFAEAEVTGTDAITEAKIQVRRMLPQIYPVAQPFPISLLEGDPVLVVEDFKFTNVSEQAYKVQFTVTSTAAMAGYVVLQWNVPHALGWFSDNAFWLLKGESKSIVFSGTKIGSFEEPSLANIMVQSLSCVARDANLFL